MPPPDHPGSLSAKAIDAFIAGRPQERVVNAGGTYRLSFRRDGLKTVVREGLELVAPDNYLPTNPQLIRQTMEENGKNLARGAKHLAEDGIDSLAIEHAHALGRLQHRHRVATADRKAVFNRKSFQPLGAHFMFPVVMSVSESSPYKRVQDVVEAAKASIAAFANNL